MMKKWGYWLTQVIRSCATGLKSLVASEWYTQIIYIRPGIRPVGHERVKEMKTITAISYFYEDIGSCATQKCH
jgi:hypothetical protein